MRKAGADTSQHRFDDAPPMTASDERQRRAFVAHETQHLALGISTANG